MLRVHSWQSLKAPYMVLGIKLRFAGYKMIALSLYNFLSGPRSLDFKGVIIV